MVGNPIYSVTLQGLRSWLAGRGEKQYRAKQAFEWLYARNMADFDAMSNLSSDLRCILKENWFVTELKVLNLQESKIDGTRKILFGLNDGESVEAVLIPDEGRLTLCISSQVGCKMGCDFCLTATEKLKRQLKCDEIVAQYMGARRVLKEDERISNIVFMGMGEPLDNYQEVKDAIAVLTDENGIHFGRRKISVSTVGIAPLMESVIKDLKVNLVLSLNAASDDVRRKLMPVTRKYPIAVLVDTLRRLPLRHGEFVMVAYVLISGVNDSKEDALKLANLLRGTRCKINLIPYNPYPGSPYKRPCEEHIKTFHKLILDNGYVVTTRISGGSDIMAACGQLRSGSCA